MRPDNPVKDPNQIRHQLERRGIIGADPRLATAEHGREVNDTIVAALVGWIQTGIIDLEW